MRVNPFLHTVSFYLLIPVFEKKLRIFEFHPSKEFTQFVKKKPRSSHHHGVAALEQKNQFPSFELVLSQIRAGVIRSHRVEPPVLSHTQNLKSVSTQNEMKWQEGMGEDVRRLTRSGWKFVENQDSLAFYVLFNAWWSDRSLAETFRTKETLCLNGSDRSGWSVLFKQKREEHWDETKICL